MSAFTLPIDIINRALQHCQQPRITTLKDHSEQAQETVFMYDKLREAELRMNLWRFATRRVILRPIGIDTVSWVPATWVNTNNYSAGAIVSYTPPTGVYAGEIFYWQTKAVKTGSTTALSPELDPDYNKFTGLLNIDLYNTGVNGTGTTFYQANEIVLVPSVYSGAVTYALNDVVRSGTTWYVSLAAGNIGNAVTDTVHWTHWTSRGRGAGSYGVTATKSPIPLTYPGTIQVFTSLYSNNQDNPISATGNWLDVTGASITPLQIVWPVGAGPLHQLSTMNVYSLPNGFLKKAPTDPKAGQTPYLGAYSGATPEDWVPEDGFLISSDSGPIMMRFVAGMIDVTAMDPTFCEMLASRIAIEAASAFKAIDPKERQAIIGNVARHYREEHRKAVVSNAIEVGPIAQVENRFVTVRA